MAQSTSTETGGWGAGFKDNLWSVLKEGAGLAIDYEKAKHVDVETVNSGGDVPGREDLIGGVPQTLGAQISGGLNSRNIMYAGLGVLLLVGTLKITKVI